MIAIGGGGYVPARILRYAFFSHSADAPAMQIAYVQRGAEAIEGAEMKSN